MNDATANIREQLVRMEELLDMMKPDLKNDARFRNLELSFYCIKGDVKQMTEDVDGLNFFIDQLQKWKT